MDGAELEDRESDSDFDPEKHKNNAAHNWDEDENFLGEGL